jgi:hypothetical protein
MTIKNYKYQPMKRLLIVFFVFAELISYGQAKVSMIPVFSFTPTSATSPSSTVNYSTTVGVKVYVKNTGTAAFNGSIKVFVKRDTLSGILCDSSTFTTTFPFQPGDTLSTTLSFIPTPGTNAFKTAGNGNTIVVWPIVSGLPPGDSARAVIWVNGPNSVYEFETSMFKIYPNPVVNTMYIKSLKQDEYKKISVYDVFARKIKELPFSENIDFSNLQSGSYWLIISSETKSYRISFIKE